MNLKHLDCADNQITSLEPLKALKLQTLECHNNKNLKDISVLAGMPLTALSLSGCSALTDISPILKCTQLERLTLPEHLVDSHLLNNLPNLKSFNDKWDDWKMTKEEFLKK
jgi:Leucine-rich repeat (LRR) protein